MIDLTPDPVALRIGDFAIQWYGVMYAVGLTAVYFLVTRLATREGRNPNLVGNGMIVIAIAALIGGRLYHVIDEWERYQADLLSIVLPPYAGLGVYGGLATGTLAGYLYVRWIKEPFWTWADIAAPGLFLMQAIGRLGNFFNQELYGTPTSLPWSIPIDAAHRVGPYTDLIAYPVDTTRFHPLFLYESLSGLVGMVALIWIGARFRNRLRPGDLLLGFFIWYAAVRFLLEPLRIDNWTLNGIPTAMLVSAAVVAVAVGALVWRHRGGGREPSEQQSGALGVDEAAGDDAVAPASTPSGTLADRARADDTASDLPADRPTTDRPTTDPTAG